MNLRYFKPEEFKNYEEMDEELLEKLDELRHRYGKSIIINSSYRSPDHPIEARKKSPGEHTQGKAVDIQCLGSRDRYNLIKLAYELKFNRIGLGPDFIHLGVSKIRDQDVFWGYYNR